MSEPLYPGEAAPGAADSRFRGLFDHAPIGIALLDPQGRLLLVNPALRHMLGYSDDELYRMTFADITHPDDLDTNWALFQELVTGARDTYSMDKRYLRMDGGILWGHLAVSVTRDKDGAPENIIGMLLDLTERKRVELALEQAKVSAEELAQLLHLQAEAAEAIAKVGTTLASALDSSTVYQIILEQAARVLPFDHAMIALYQDGWVVSVATLGGPAIPPATTLVPVNPRTSTWRALTSGKPVYLADTAEIEDWTDPAPWRGPYRVRCAIVVPLVIDDVLIGSFQLNSYVPHFYSEQQIHMATMFGERATQAVRNARLFAAEQERTRVAEELAQLRQEQAEVSEVLAHVSAALAGSLEPEHLYQVILEQAARVLPCDHACVTLYGDGVATFMATWGEPRIPAGTTFPMNDLWLPDPGSGVAFVADTNDDPHWNALPPLDGPYRERSVLSAPLTLEGTLIGSFDVSSRTPHLYNERHRYLAAEFATRATQALANARLFAAEQARVRAAERLASLQRDFVAAVSHELRTPLTAIIGFGELLEARWGTMSEARRLERIAQIVQAANRQKRLVEDLLLAGRLEGANLTPRSETLLTADLVRRAADELLGSYPGQAIVLVGPANLQVRADTAHTMQVLTNLLENAAKYSPEGSPITVRWEQEEEMMVLRVIDRGSGVPEQGRDRLFTRFGRLPGSAIRGGRVGTGLGLFISRGLAEAMGGSLDLEATGPTGSTFRLRLKST